MIDCPNGDIRDLLPDLANGRLDASERARVEAHVAGCEACQDELALLRDLRATIRRVPAIDTRAIAAAIPPYRAPVRRTWSSWRVAAAVATIAIGGTSIALVNRRPTAATTEIAAVTPSRPAAQQAPAGSPGASAPSTPNTVAGTSKSGTASGPAVPTVEQPVRELAMGGGTVGDLSDRELTALLADIESLDALPSAEVEATPVTPLAPSGGAR